MFRGLVALAIPLAAQGALAAPFDSAFLVSPKQSEAAPAPVHKEPKRNSSPESIPAVSQRGNRDAISFQAEIASLTELIKTSSSQKQMDSLRVNRASALLQLYRLRSLQPEGSTHGKGD